MSCVRGKESSSLSHTQGLPLNAKAEYPLFAKQHRERGPPSCFPIRDHGHTRVYVQHNFASYSRFLKPLDSRPCGDPEQPLSSVVNRTSVSTVEYTCVKGHRLEGGDAIRKCKADGQWSGKPPRCVEVQCQHPASVKDGFIEVKKGP